MRSVDRWEDWKCRAKSYTFGGPKLFVMRPVTQGGNDAYRVREHLTEAEMDKLLAALKRNRHGHRDWLIGLIVHRYGLLVSEACDLRWDDIGLPSAPLSSAGSRAVPTVADALLAYLDGHDVPRFRGPSLMPTGPKR